MPSLQSEKYAIEFYVFCPSNDEIKKLHKHQEKMFTPWQIYADKIDQYLLMMQKIIN